MINSNQNITLDGFRPAFSSLEVKTYLCDKWDVSSTFLTVVVDALLQCILFTTEVPGEHVQFHPICGSEILPVKMGFLELSHTDNNLIQDSCWKREIDSFMHIVHDEDSISLISEMTGVELVHWLLDLQQ